MKNVNFFITGFYLQECQLLVIYDTSHCVVLPRRHFDDFLIIVYKPDVQTTTVTIRHLDVVNAVRPFSAQRYSVQCVSCYWLRGNE
jgi:hypothetical protein